MEADSQAWDATVEELRKDLERAHDKLKDTPKDTAAPAQAGGPTPVDRGVMPVSPAAATEAAAAAGIGQTVGTFSSTAEGLGIGPELNKLEQPAIQTAANTAATVEALQGISRGLGGQPMAAGGGIAAEVAAPRAPAVAQAARAGTAVADSAGIAQVMQSGFTAIVTAITAHAKLTEAGNGTLSKIDGKLSSLGAVFA